MTDMLSVKQAATLIMQALSSLPPKPIKKPLYDALGYHLSHAITAERDYPPFDRITMDGIAINYAAYVKGKRDFILEAYAAAGSPQITLSNIDNAIEVATGAPLPNGTDTVIPYEECTLEGKRAVLHSLGNLKKGNAIHAQASDMKQGDILLHPQHAIGLTEIGILAANGVAQVPVYQKPSIGIVVTGNELVPVDAAIEPYQIRRSNDLTLKAALTLNGFSDVEIIGVPDDKKEIERTLAKLVVEKDIVLITGGISRGARDFVPDALANIGVKAIFHHVAQRPGKPLWFGKKEHTLVFGLPGNPNSTLVCLMRYVIPALIALSGGHIPKPGTKMLAASLTPHEKLTLFIPVTLQEDGRARAITTRTSGDFTSLLGSSGFIELANGADVVQAGVQVPYYPWRLAA